MNRLIKQSLLTATFVFIGLINSSNASAANLEIMCDEGTGNSQCKIVSASKTLFNVQNVTPGATYPRQILVKNNDGNDDCNLKMSIRNAVSKPAGFAQKFLVAIQANGHSPFVGEINSANEATNKNNMQDVFDAEYIKFGKVTKDGGSVLYNWVVTLDGDTDNSFQSSELQFDFRINFTCDHDSNDEESEPGIVAGISTSTPNVSSSDIADEQAVENSLRVAGAQTFRDFAEEVDAFACKDKFVPWVLVALFVALVILHNFVVKTKNKWVQWAILGIPIAAYYLLCNKQIALIMLIAYIGYGIFSILRKRPV
jgi:hypothetical protein